MTVSCPGCGSRYLRASRCRSVRERMRSLLGISPLRCADCGTWFVARTWDLSVITHSRCPKCLRMDLNVWTDQQFWPGPLTKLMINWALTPGAANTAATILRASGRAWKRSASIGGGKEHRRGREPILARRNPGEARSRIFPRRVVPRRPGIMSPCNRSRSPTE